MDSFTIISLLAGFVAEVGILIGAVAPLFKRLAKITNGQKCQLRHDMLRVYYRHHESGTIRQYEYENFMACYDAYKALGGNSFIDKIHAEVKEWEVIS